MKLLARELFQVIIDNMKPNKVCLLLGSRRVGKTILLKEISGHFTGKSLMMNGEDLNTRRILAERTAANYRQLLYGVDLLIIDEAQTLEDIGLILKLMVDEIPGIKIIASGSSSFDLLNRSGEPLTGRSARFQLFPLSQIEFGKNENLTETRANLGERIIFGGYPELLHIENPEEKKKYLQEIVQMYLLKDILILDGIRAASKMMDLLQMIAYQTGKEVSSNELSLKLNLSKNTVDKYLDLLSKVFIIFKLGGYSRNLRKEIVKTSKWYFYDNGIRNAVLSDFSSISVRKDMGELWENYIIAERIKMNGNRQRNCRYYFWRTYDQQEIDLIEVHENQVNAFEIKWGTTKPVKVPVAFRNAYPEASFQAISPDNYLNFIT